MRTMQENNMVWVVAQWWPGEVDVPPLVEVYKDPEYAAEEARIKRADDPLSEVELLMTYVKE